MYRILSSKEWLERILDHGHFGEARQLYSNLAELKWKSGLRIYFSIMRDKENRIVVLLLGGNKNSQKSDIKRAKNLLNGFQKV